MSDCLRRLVLSVSMLGCAAACEQPAALPPIPAPKGPSAEVPGAGDFSHQAFPWPLRLTDAEAILRRTELFMYGSMPPKRQVQAWNLILDQPDATERFMALARDAEPAGRLYALCGLLAMKAAQAVQVANELAARDEKLYEFAHDGIHIKTVAELAGVARSPGFCDAMRAMKNETDQYFERSSRARPPR